MHRRGIFNTIHRSEAAIAALDDHEHEEIERRNRGAQYLKEELGLGISYTPHSELHLIDLGKTPCRYITRS
jgi:hypothetical protein